MRLSTSSFVLLFLSQLWSASSGSRVQHLLEQEDLSQSFLGQPDLGSSGGGSVLSVSPGVPSTGVGGSVREGSSETDQFDVTANLSYRIKPEEQVTAGPLRINKKWTN